MTTPQRRRLLSTPSSSGPQVLHRSTFTAPDGTALGAYVPEVGGPWTVPTGTMQINGNAAAATALVSNQALAYFNLGQADVALGCTVANLVGTDSAYLLTRYTDLSNFWFAGLLGGTGAVIFEVAAGVSTQRASAALTTTGSHRLVVSPHGATIDLYVDGVLACTYPSAASGQASTFHGLRARIVGTTFDSVVAYRTGAVSVPAGVV